MCARHVMQRALVPCPHTADCGAVSEFFHQGKLASGYPAMEAQLQCSGGHWERPCFSKKLCRHSADGSVFPVSQRQGAQICCSQSWPLFPHFSE